MDRRWIHVNQFTPAAIANVREFMQFMRARYNENDEILFPCSHCLNHKCRARSLVEEHLFVNGMSRTYNRWIHHEELDVEVIDDPNQGNENPDVMGPGAMDWDGVEEDNDYDDHLPDVVGDLYRAAEKEKRPPRIASVFEDAKKQLYPGRSNFSRFSFLVKLLHLKSYHRISNAGFSALLKLFSKAYPKSALPTSYNEAKNYLRELGIGYNSIHVRKNNCVLFWKDYADLDDCPICGVSRWKDPDGRKQVPQKVLRQFPRIPRLKRLFVSKKIVEEARWHELKRQHVKGQMSHPADGEAWKDFDRKYPDFAKDARKIRLGISTDGFNPFGNMSTSYSMWPVIVVPYNMPPWACMDQSDFLISLLIPRPKSPGKDFDVFLEPLIEELVQL